MEFNRDRKPLTKFILCDDGIYVCPDSQLTDFNYSDGYEIENRIYQDIKQSQDLSIYSKELTNKIVDWPSEYHFSPQRHNLLRHIKFTKSDNILELGCGCGAMTRFLGESGAAIDAIEGSSIRAKCAAARCRDLSNVNIYCSDFQSIEFEKKYDYVTLIGVLEYSPFFFESEDPFSSCVNIAKDALKPGGKLILAIENRLGLKYFMGLGEDHTAVPFLGIQDLYKKGTYKTFGRNELIDLFRSNGFENLDFYYPFPDYKLPEVILSEKAFQVAGFSSIDLIYTLKSRDYSFEVKPLFSEKLVWQQLAKNGLVRDFSNSFLLVASLDGYESELTSEELLAIKYILVRKKEYNTQTIFYQNKNEKSIKVKKVLLNDSNYIGNDIIIHRLGEDNYYSGNNMARLIDNAVLTNDFDRFVKLLEVWIKFIIDKGLKVKNEKEIYCSIIRDEYIDCIPGNLILDGKNVYYIDKEWSFNENVQLSVFLMRYLIYYEKSDFINNNIQGESSSLQKIFSFFKIPFNKNLYDNYKILDREILCNIYSKEYISKL
ncbi:MAG TPA: hypothetical protein DCS13_04930 [Candidatus Margulisbacteria bacterium]|nr:MAG: hypothetical protein A2X43_00245 [Candidatus Margulisbacteria bacterium GWD2_39_127]HAR62789.1 hypothetical protein [Candidatus Margulisiibacteriota bacterium]